MALFDRIANYFMEWDGIDETAPKMELNIHELRYIADINVERCRLIRQLNEANLKTEKMLMDKTNEIRERAITEFAEEVKKRAYSTERIDWAEDYMISIWKSLIDEIASELKGE